jgi:hypothetical protein
MKGLFWNNRVLRDLAKYKFLYDTSYDIQLDFIALLENFSAVDLDHFCGGKDFLWHWTSPRRQSGGILLSVNLQLFDIGDITLGDFHIKFNIRNKEDGFEWVLIATYGAAQDELKKAFLTEMVKMCNIADKPILIGGDFNIIRRPSEKNNDKYNDRWPFFQCLY